MKSHYQTAKGKLCLFLIPGLLFAFSSRAQQVVTYDTTFAGWNAIVTEDISLQGTDSAAGIVFFPGIGEMDNNVNDLAVNGPHYLINNGLWDGSVTLGNGVHHPFIISLQPPASGYPASEVLPKIQAILARYRIKRNSFYFTALSQGAWQANEFLTYEPTPGDDSYGRLVKAMVNLEGVEPADYTGIYSSLPYPNKMGHWAAACGGRELWMEGSQDWRDMQAGAQNMLDSVPGSATYFMVAYGGGAHCCWNTEYDPATTWTMSSNPNISQVTGAPQAMNVWQWLLRQGDTSMPGSQVAATPPTVNAGAAMTVTLPVDSAVLSGTVQANGGVTVSSSTWTQVSGPNTATIGSPAAAPALMSAMTAGTLTDSSQQVSAPITGLVAGTYVFELTAQESNGLTSASTVTVVVNAAVVSVPPTVSAGKGQEIGLPQSSVTLDGMASGAGGAAIATVVWVQETGPVPATIVSPSSTTTTVSGLTEAGSYIFKLLATDDNGLTANGSMTVTVRAETDDVPPTVRAGKGQLIVLPTSSVILDGEATGNNGATIGTVTWIQESGPVTATIGSPFTTTTPVSGMTVAGNYIFKLSATDNNGLSAHGSMTVYVDAAGTASVAGTVLSGQATAMTDSATTGDPTTATSPEGSLLTFPSPVRDLLNIRLNNTGTGKVMLMIFNTMGNRIQATELEKDWWDLEATVDVSRLAPGVYVLEVMTGSNSRTTQKFIKQ